MRVVRTQESPLTDTRLVTFEQTQTSIPIFGSIARIEMDKKRRLVAVDAEVADVPDVAPVASISPADALERIAVFTSVDASALEAGTPPDLTYYHDDNQDTWHLAYFFRNVPAAPAEFTSEATAGAGGETKCIQQAEIIADFVDDLLTADSEAWVVVAGDFNWGRRT